MEIDEPVRRASDSRKSLSVPNFLINVFNDELNNVGGNGHDMLIIAVHAIMQESGFVGFDPVSNTLVNRLEFPKERNLFYTLPNLIGTGTGTAFVVLKFQTLGRFLNVYGSVSSGGTTHSIRLDEDMLIQFLNSVWANCGSSDEIVVDREVRSETTTPEAEVFKFWKNVKDSLALPLLMDLCEKAGLKLPPCFTVLPAEIKLKIFESLSGEELAKVGSVCTELRCLTSSEDLWKQKFEDRFGNAKGVEATWKAKFVELFRSRKIYSTPRVGLSFVYRGPRDTFPNPGPRDIFPNIGPFGNRNYIGGDYDRLPNLNFGMPPQLGSFNRSRNHTHIPNCDFDG